MDYNDDELPEDLFKVRNNGIFLSTATGMEMAH
jgi:hypothetical protein